MTQNVRWRRKCETASPHQLQPGGFPVRMLSSTWCPAHGVGAQNNAGSSVLLDFRSVSRCCGPGGIVLSMATAQFTRACRREAGSGHQRPDADCPSRTASQRSARSGADRLSVGIDGSRMQPGLWSPGFLASGDREVDDDQRGRPWNPRGSSFWAASSTEGGSIDPSRCPRLSCESVSV